MLYVHYGFIVCFKGYTVYDNAKSCFFALNLGVHTHIINTKHGIKLWVSHSGIRAEFYFPVDSIFERFARKIL